MASSSGWAWKASNPGTAAEVIGVVDIDRRQIGEGTPGPITRQLVKRYRQHARSSGTPIA